LIQEGLPLSSSTLAARAWARVPALKLVLAPPALGVAAAGRLQLHSSACWELST